VSKYGFVYVLSNPSFPGVYKVGCTERSPQQRADELSKGTGVPTEFSVIAYIECAKFQWVERDIHVRLAEYRVNRGREFFTAPLELIARLMFFHPENISWVDRMCRENIEANVWLLNDPYKDEEAYLDFDECTRIANAGGM
jgi:hypothetical protein